jgi:hypothetical protein
LTVSLPDPVVYFLKERNLPVPYWTARNPFLGIIQSVWQRALSGDPKIQANIETMDNIVYLHEKPALDPERIIDAAQSPDPTEQDTVIEPTAKAGSPNYVMISRYAMLVCASIDQNNKGLLDGNPIKVLKEYVKWRKENSTLALPSPRAGRSHTKGEQQGEDIRTDEERATASREVREALRQGQNRLASSVEPEGKSSVSRPAQAGRDEREIADEGQWSTDTQAPVTGEVELNPTAESESSTSGEMVTGDATAQPDKPPLGEVAMSEPTVEETTGLVTIKGHYVRFDPPQTEIDWPQLSHFGYVAYEKRDDGQVIFLGHVCSFGVS